LFDDGFVELLNLSFEEVNLSSLDVRFSPLPAGTPWPERTAGTRLPLPGGVLAPGARLVVALNGEDGEIADAPWNEGVISLWQTDVEAPLERIDFMHWPDGAVLSRQPDGTGRHVFCSDDTRGVANDVCQLVPEREVDSHLRHLRTPGADLFTFEYVSDRDAIPGELMKRGFWAAMERVQQPTRWSLRPENQNQVDAALSVDGQLPIVTPSAPYQNRGHTSP
jgi:hypothetical protein